LLIELVAPFLKTLMDMPQLSLLRRALLFGVALNLCLIAVRVLLYRPLLAMPGALRFIVEPVIVKGSVLTIDTNRYRSGLFIPETDPSSLRYAVTSLAGAGASGQ
jgi:hypothetical protein